MKLPTLVATAAFATFCTTAALSGPVVELEPNFPAPAPAETSTDDESTGLWFVEMNGAPTADGGILTSVRAEKQAFRNNARKAGLKFQERFAYDTLFNGLSVAVDRKNLSTLSRLPGVKSIYMIDRIALPRTTESTPELFTALAMTGADVAQNELGLDGTGVKVAIMDTGIDIDHPDFGGNGSDDSTSFPTARVVTGYDFVGDAFDGSNTPVPDGNPDDCGGHGSHVAGIVGANGVVKGVAPGVTFGAYRVFGCAGSTTADIMVAAMERALADDMDVLNMSIGSSFQWPQYPTAMAASRLVNKGMVVVASIGNSGANGLFAAGAPGLGAKVIGVANFNNSHYRLTAFSLSPDNALVGFFPATGAPAPPTSGTVAMARTGTPASTADGCSALAPGSLSGKIALIRRGSCPFHTKSANAQAAGAAGVVLYNNAPAGEVAATVAVGYPPITIPVVGISAVQGALINGRIAGGGVDLTWGTQKITVTDPNGGLIASSSSYGLAPDLTLKPDIGAPGGNIYSTYPLELGGYATLTGTSMSSPHVAGTAALLLQAAPNTSAQSVRGILQNTAEPKAWWGNPTLGFLDNVHRQGAGMVQIDDAILTATRLEPSKLALGEGEAGPVSNALTFRNSGAAAVTYTVSSVNALSTGSFTHTPSIATSDASVAFSAPSVVVPAGGSASVTATITPASSPSGGQYGGYLVFTPDDGSAKLRVPFAGYIGDYQARQVLKPTGLGLPWLAQIGGGNYQNRPAGATYTMSGDNIPFFLVHFDHQARTMKLDVTDAATGKSWHRAFQEDYLPRNSTSTGFFAFSWDGVTTAGGKSYVVPNGSYKVKLSVLKALGDAANPAHWEVWNSSTITIARP